MHPPGSVNLPCKEVKMKIAHIALWTRQLEQQARFWTSFFNGQINEKYCCPANPGFES